MACQGARKVPKGYYLALYAAVSTEPGHLELGEQRGPEGSRNVPPSNSILCISPTHPPSPHLWPLHSAPAQVWEVQAMARRRKTQVKGGTDLKGVWGAPTIGLVNEPTTRTYGSPSAW